MRIVLIVGLIVGLGPLVIWSWATSVVDQAVIGSVARSGADLLVFTTCLVVFFCCALVILTVGFRIRPPLKRHIPGIRKATAVLLLILAIQILGTGTILAVYRPRGTHDIILAHDCLPCVGSWFFGDMDKRPAATYRFAFNHFQITYLFDSPHRQGESEEWDLVFIPHTGDWPIQILRDSETTRRIPPLDTVFLLYWFDGP